MIKDHVENNSFYKIKSIFTFNHSDTRSLIEKFFAFFEYTDLVIYFLQSIIVAKLSRLFHYIITCDASTCHSTKNSLLEEEIWQMKRVGKMVTSVKPTVQ